MANLYGGGLNETRKSSIYTRPCLVKGWSIAFLVCALFLLFLNSTWKDEYVQIFIRGIKQDKPATTNYRHRHHSKAIHKPLIIACPVTNPTCNKTSSPSQNSNDTFSKSPSPSCPEYFRYIHEDLKPWKSTGITKEIVESARKHVTVHFRLVIVDGKAYIEKYNKPFQTRDVFTIWGILQLLNRYPGRVPDLDLMFDCEDPPTIKVDDFRSLTPPPLFRYCKDNNTLGIVFPDWSFWGWAEVNIKPWNKFVEETKIENERVKWEDREPFAYWKGNPDVAETRRDLLRCNVSNGQEWNARLFNQNWKAEGQNGFKESNLAKQCTYRYKIYIEGRSWSVSQKYILACNSPVLLVTTQFIDFFTRGLIPGRHYLPIRPDKKCKSIKYAVDWGNKHQNEAEDIGKTGSLFTQEELSMDNVYDYMLHLLTEYAKLLKYKPSIPEKATEVCIESMVCPEFGKVKQFLIDSMEKYEYDFEPCTLGPPFSQKEMDDIDRSKEDYMKEMERREDGWVI